MAHHGWGDGWTEVDVPLNPPRAQLKRQTAPKQRPKHRVRNILLSLLGVLLLAGGLIGWVGYQALQARDRLQTAVTMIPALEQQVRVDPDGATPHLAALQVVTSEAKQHTSGAMWNFAEHLPVAGPNLRALSSITEIVDSLAHDVLPELSSAVQSVQPAALAPTNGRIDLNPILNVRDNVVSADQAVNRAIESIARVDRAPLVGQLSQAADDLEGRLRDLSTTTATASRAVQLIPAALGSEGQRTWLILAQNNSEQRATGGIAGAVIAVRTDHGQIDIVEKASTSRFHPPDESVLPLTSEELQLWGDRMGRWIQDVNLTPDFPRSAQLAAQMWLNVAGEPVTGVLSVDPVMLQQMIAATGPVTFTDPLGEPITLTGQNTASFLLSEVYSRFEDPHVQDEVFGMAAEAIFQQVTHGGVDAAGVIDALVAAADQGRLRVWSAVDEEQILLAPTVLSGELRGSQPAADGTTSPVVRVAVNLDSGSKLGYYLATTAQVRDVVERPDGSQSFSLDLTFTNRLAEGQGYALPAYVIGNAPANGQIGIHVFVYAPRYGEILSAADFDGEPVNAVLTTHRGYGVGIFPIEIDPGAEQTMQIQIISGREQRGPIELVVTPGPNPNM